MITEVVINPTANRTPDVFHSKKWLSVEPFQSCITGLMLVLCNVNGIEKRIPIPDTTLPVRGNISEYNYFWFEYQSADKEYRISVNLE